MHLPPVRQLQYLVALRKELHFGKAASSLNVTQSTLSSGIRELETSLGITLVERTNRSVSFTMAGEKITDRARYVLMQVEDLVTEAKSLLTHWPYRSNWALYQLSLHLLWVISLTPCRRQALGYPYTSEKIQQRT